MNLILTFIPDRSVKLDQEFYSHVKPGLSSFADDPKQGAETVKSLLDKAKSVIPKALWHQVGVNSLYGRLDAHV